MIREGRETRFLKETGFGGTENFHNLNKTAIYI